MWTVRVNGIPERLNDKAFTVNGKTYSFDSCSYSRSDSDGSSGYNLDVYIFDHASYRVVAYGHCAYLWGGWHDSPGMNGLRRFDTVSMTWSRPQERGDVPRSQISHSACVLGHRMYIFGGFDRNSLNIVRFLDLETLEWHRVPTSGEAPARRYCHTASAIGTRMYVWGGNLGSSQPNERYDNSLYYLETTTATWVRPQVQGVAPEGRECHSAFVYDRELYIFGGYNETAGHPLHRYAQV
ncbi:hypothetical protein V5799_020177 [Amblyomma americanum]|uniref:Uncharacterized protein n=1 Tax=Amblyomma americanum TaxID=6943 RepID=A0AAQ4EVH9_AMBAM